MTITEGTYIQHPVAGSYPDVPHFYGEDSLAGWKHVVEEVHRAGGKIFPQIWHVGLTPAYDGTLPAWRDGPFRTRQAR